MYLHVQMKEISFGHCTFLEILGGCLVLLRFDMCQSSQDRLS